MSGLYDPELFGHPKEYWLELDKRFRSEVGPTAEKLLEEVIELRGKLAFYESRIEQMHTAMKRHYP